MYSMISSLLIITLLVQSYTDAARHIAIIGAGFSGLTAAYRLMQKGYDVVIYEARPRVGGRVLSGLMQGKSGKLSIIELGAESIADGGEACNIRALLDEFAIPLINAHYYSGYCRYFDGIQLVTPEMSLPEYGFTTETSWDYLLKLSTQSYCMDDVLKLLFASNEQLYAFFSLRLACYEGGPVTKLSATYISTLHRMMLKGINAVPDRTTRIPRISGGNSQLAEALAQRLGDNLHLNEQLRKIEKSLDGRFILTFHSGKLVQVDSVVLTVPCPIYNDIEFGAEIMPEQQLANIRNVEYGENSKIWASVQQIKVDSVFATERFCGRSLNNDECTIFYYRGPYGHFSRQTFADVVARDVLAGPFAQKVTTDDITLARDENFAVYTGIVGKSWPLDPYAKGSYSYINAGQEELFTAIEDYHGEKIRSLFAPAGNLFFAGEHTTILLDVLGTMEAAVESGERIARVIESIDNECK